MTKPVDSSRPGSGGRERTREARSGAVRDAVTAALRDAVLRGVHAPGERLPPERRIAEQLGVGRGSVREALKRLDQLGLVEITHGGGARVRPLEDASLDIVGHLLALEGGPGVELVSQLLEVHELMLTGAVALAVRNATEPEISRAVALLESLADDGVEDDTYMAALDELVLLISTASRNLILRLVRNGLQSVYTALPGGGSIRARRPKREIVAPLARAIADALTARDAERAQEGVRRLLRAHGERILKRMESHAPGNAPGPQA